MVSCLLQRLFTSPEYVLHKEGVMAKIQARNVDDALFARIEQSAMKNERSLEGEIRQALARQYPAGTTSPEILSSRQQWQKECGGRLGPRRCRCSR